MKRLLILSLLLLLIGCTTFINLTFDETNYQGFVDGLLTYELGEKADAIYLDLRPLGDPDFPGNDDFASGHIHGFVSYDISNGSREEFITWIKGMAHISTAVFLVDATGENVITVANWLAEENYQTIYAFTGGYQTLVQLARDDLYIVTGIDDCGC